MTQLVEIVDVPEMGTTGNLLTKTRIFPSEAATSSPCSPGLR